MARVLLNLPQTARRGEVIEIRTLIQHVMETGYRLDGSGQPIPRDILRSFTCVYNNAEVFRAEFSPAIAANPFLSFTVVAEEDGILIFTWTGDNGFEQRETRRLTVT